MDILSHAVEAMRTGRPRSFVTEYHAPWGVSFPPSTSAGFHVLLEGSALLFPREDESIQLRAGDVVFMPRGGVHGMSDGPGTPLRRTDFEEDGLGVWVNESGVHRRATPQPNGSTPSAVVVCGTYQLDRTRTHPLLQEFPDFVHLPTGLGKRPALRGAIELLYNEIRIPQAGADLVVPALIDTLLLYILRTWIAEQPCEDHTGWVAMLRDPAMTTALDGLHRNPERPWTVQRLGELAGLSRAAFARRFTEMVGQPPMAYLTWWRLTSAAKLLRGTDLPLSAIAERVGYGTEFALGNAFKREFGVPPGLYRRQHEPLEPTG